MGATTHRMGTPGYYMGTVPEQLAAEVRRPDLGSRVQGLSARLSSAAEDLAFRQSLYARERSDMEDRLVAMQAHVAAMQGEKARAETAWWTEKEALLRGWTGDHNRLMALMDGGVPAEMVPLPMGPPVATGPPVGTEAIQIAGDRMMQELSMLRHERSMAAVPERRATEFRVRSLEVQLARENHARDYASYANADRGVGAFRREINAKSGETVPIGDKLNSQLRQTEADSLKARVGELQGRVQELEKQLASKRS